MSSILVKLDKEPQIKKIEENDIIYSLNEEEKTASIIGIITENSEILIPKSIKYNTKEYVITSILEGSFRNSIIKSLNFTQDSKLQMIDKDSFFWSSIESITIPSQVTELRDGWCNRTPKIKKIDVSPYNQYYTKYEDNLIIGKTTAEQTNFNCIVFCSRSIKSIIIPNFIEHIRPYAFHQCKLCRVKFQNNSKLKIIDNDAFRGTSIESITIPSQVREIKDNSFFLLFGTSKN